VLRTLPRRKQKATRFALGGPHDEVTRMANEKDDDESSLAANARAEALRACDPRAGQSKHRARLRLYGDDDRDTLTRFERGAELEEFIDPDNLTTRQTRNRSRRVRRRGGGATE
jgi:hypothetical protein